MESQNTRSVLEEARKSLGLRKDLTDIIEVEVNTKTLSRSKGNPRVNPGIHLTFESVVAAVVATVAVFSFVHLGHKEYSSYERSHFYLFKGKSAEQRGAYESCLYAVEQVFSESRYRRGEAEELKTRCLNSLHLIEQVREIPSEEALDRLEGIQLEKATKDHPVLEVARNVANILHQRVRERNRIRERLKEAYKQAEKPEEVVETFESVVESALTLEETQQISENINREWKKNDLLLSDARKALGNGEHEVAIKSVDEIVDEITVLGRPLESLEFDTSWKKDINEIKERAQAGISPQTREASPQKLNDQSPSQESKQSPSHSLPPSPKQPHPSQEPKQSQKPQQSQSKPPLLRNLPTGATNAPVGVGNEDED